MKQLESFVDATKLGASEARRIERRVVQALLLAGCLLLPGQIRAESPQPKSPKQAPVGYASLAGQWQRTDGGYVLQLSDMQADGRLKAAYFNPRSINVSKAEWRRMGDRIQVFIELRDVNYPGSTYLIVYSPESDQLEGYYHHAALGQTFDVVFARMR